MSGYIFTDCKLLPRSPNYVLYAQHLIVVPSPNSVLLPFVIEEFMARPLAINS